MTSLKLAIYHLLGRWERVMEVCENALLHDPNNVQLLYSLAIAAERAGYIDTAIAWHYASLELEPGHGASSKALKRLLE